MAKNMLLVMPKLTSDEKFIIRNTLNIKDDQILSFQNKWKTAWALNKKGHKRLAKKILWYIPLIDFAINYHEIMCVILVILAGLGLFAGSIALIAYLIVNMSPWWAIVVVPFVVIIIAGIKTILDYLD